jgi:hypothetical protein
MLCTVLCTVLSAYSTLNLQHTAAELATAAAAAAGATSISRGRSVAGDHHEHTARSCYHYAVRAPAAAAAPTLVSAVVTQHLRRCLSLCRTLLSQPACSPSALPAHLPIAGMTRCWRRWSSGLPTSPTCPPITWRAGRCGLVTVVLVTVLHAALQMV